MKLEIAAGVMRERSIVVPFRPTSGGSHSSGSPRARRRRALERPRTVFTRWRAILLGTWAVLALGAFGAAAAAPGVTQGLRVLLVVVGYISFILLFRSAMRSWRADWDESWVEARAGHRKSLRPGWPLVAMVGLLCCAAPAAGQETILSLASPEVFNTVKICPEDESLSRTGRPNDFPMAPTTDDVAGIEPVSVSPIQSEGNPHSETAPKSYRFHGWLQEGFTANFDSPRDRINFGVNFNWRSNDYRLNQLCLVLENPLEHENRFNLGYRVDFLVGHDAPFFAANGLFSNFTGFDATSGVGLEGPRSFREVNRIGIDLPQFFVDVFVPGLITARGIDFRIGKFYTLMGREVYPAPDTDFYSRTYENVYGTPFTHTGVLATVHASETLDVVAGVVRGWDVFKDNNGRPSYHGGLIWISRDKRYNLTTAWITGPEQPDDNHRNRTEVSSYLTVKFGSDDKWLLSTGGHFAVEEKAAVDPVSGRLKGAEWYAYSAHLFYTVDPRVRLALRGEWFRDDDGTRTGTLKRPGFAASFYDVTLGATYQLRESVRLRPEVRVDWTPDARPYGDQTRSAQGTAALDVVWTF